MTDPEKLTHFSTLFAVRAPGIEGGSDASPLSLATLLGSLARSDFASVASGNPARPNQVTLTGEDFKPSVRIGLPRGW